MNVLPKLCLSSSVAFWLVAFGLNAQTNAPATSTALANGWLRAQSSVFEPWDLGGQFRARVEYKNYFAAAGQPGAVDFAAQGDRDNAYLLLREKIHVGYTPIPWLSVFAEGRDSSAQNDDRKPSPDVDQLDLHQGYLRLGDAKSFPVSAKIGRQEMQFGDERLIGNADWNNIPRSFDAARITYASEPLQVDGFVSRPVIPRDDRFNIGNEHDYFSGIYATLPKLLPKAQTDFYFLSRNTGVDSATAVSHALVGLPSARDIYTVGSRVSSAPETLHGWDYDAETAYQFGRFKTSAAGKSLDHQAVAAHVGVGYTLKETAGQPRLGVEYNYASGDSSSTDRKHGTFDNLFPTNHRNYGTMDFFSWQNMHNLRLASSVKPTKRLTVTLDLHGFWLANTDDAFYTVAGAARTAGGYGIKPGSGSFVGMETDLNTSYRFTSYAALQGGYGHFFVGDYVKNSLSVSGGSKDANWIYTQLIVNF
jgi:hypothetical protein